MGNLWWDMNDINWNTRAYSAWGAYGQVKLANVLFIKGLQKRLISSEQGKQMLAMCVDPKCPNAKANDESEIQKALETK
jgi:hypothetical protein